MVASFLPIRSRSILTLIAPISDLQKTVILPLCEITTSFTPRRILLNCALRSLAILSFWLICHRLPLVVFVAVRQRHARSIGYRIQFVNTNSAIHRKFLRLFFPWFSLGFLIGVQYIEKNQAELY